MSTFPLVLELGQLNPAALRAANFVMRDRRLTVQVRFVRSPQHPPAERVLRLESGSLVRPLVTVLWGGDTEKVSPDHTSVGLSTAVWLDGSVSLNRHLATPLPKRPLRGEPDPGRPWLLVAPGVGLDASALERATGLSRPQLHVLRPSRSLAYQDSVWWLPTKGVLESLLTRVDAVVAPNGPLAWDAERAGAAVFDVARTWGVPTELSNRRLARVVPETLARDAGFWRAFVSELIAGHSGSAWGSVPWLRQAREHAHTRGGGTGRMQRKLLKLRRDPAGFVADSKFVQLFSRARSLAPRAKSRP